MASTKLVADVALQQAGQVLLVRYRDVSMYDGQRGWFLPDDYLRRFEHPLDAGARILREQVGVQNVELDLGFIESFAGGEDWHIVFHLTAKAHDPVRPEPLGNTAEARWFDLSSLPPRSDTAHEGWALDILETLSRPRTESIQVRSLVE